MSMILAIVGLSLIIVIHEMGHAIAARALGIQVFTFSFGFGPVIFAVTLDHWWDDSRDDGPDKSIIVRFVAETSLTSRKAQWRLRVSHFWLPIVQLVDPWIVGICFCLSALPFGGYVQMDDSEMAAAKTRNKIAVFFAGPLTNILSYAVIAMFALCVVGFEGYVPKDRTPFVITDEREVFSSLPDGIENVSVGDEIVGYIWAKKSFLTVADLNQAYDEAVDPTCIIVYEDDDGQLWRWEVDGSFADHIKVSKIGKIRLKPLVGAKEVAVEIPLGLWGVIQELWEKDEPILGGPIGAIHQTTLSFEKSTFHGLQIVALISLSIGIVNLFPIPIFDGGQIFVVMFMRLLPPKAASWFSATANRCNRPLWITQIIIVVIVFVWMTTRDLSNIFNFN